jgi:rhodanese-related sulfurtransferase
LSSQLSAQNLHALIVAGNELALIDLREEGEFANRHLLFAISIALSRLELKFAAMVPRRDVPIVLCGKGGDTNLTDLGYARLSGFGYTDIRILEGGVDAWERAGYELFSGVNVPSKAFGEFVEHTEGTPHISAAEVNRMMAADENMIILDSRPMSEYKKMNIPTGINVPGAELAYRLADLAPDPETTVIVNCAGRTRSIIGAQSLINAGVPNKVIALENGTMGWHLAGFELGHGQTEHYPELSENARVVALTCAANVTRRFGVNTASLEQIRDWQAEGDRTTYILDVRAPDEFTAGHLPGSISAPGGQLVQATDRYVGVRGARLVLVDDDGVRATMTASWLIQLGWPDVVVLDGGLTVGGDLESGRYRPEALGLDDGEVELISATELSEIRENVTVVDLAASLHYRDAGHIPGAWFAIRARLSESLGRLPKADTLVLTSPDGKLARIAANDDALKGVHVRVLEGGTRSWRSAGMPIETGFSNMADNTDDLWYRPYDMDDANEGAMKQYLSWEVNLVAQLERDGTTTFKSFPK